MCPFGLRAVRRYPMYRADHGVRTVSYTHLLGRPRLFALLGRDESLTIPWQEIETIGTDAILVHTAAVSYTHLRKTLG